MHASLRYLTSHEHMGIVRLECVQNCSCAPLHLDAHRNYGSQRNMSIFEAADFNITGESKECTLHLQVLPETTSGQHKFKVNQIVLSPLP